MIARVCIYGSVLGMLGLILAGILSASASANTVPASNVAFTAFEIDANALKPAACASLDLSSIITASGVITGNTGGTLILGGRGDDTLAGLGGGDCIVGGGGDDVLRGGGGNDVLIGGRGNDTCVGGSGENTLIGCESEAP
ncbi:MAG TPA: hypothetical protein PLO33_09435 [Kouleothrix sp.]|uniref:hypothetical protein n=1 Tax=Kouleothrix sp. TaxID=2779161 RepID=UPI002C8DF08F|nr:hypothetical protein [Kouleothrix sp.]HRC75892.1 hypothetical protein [Kouleothrix sp.]